MSIGLLALLDDISMLADDTAAMTKIAAKKTSAILGDDLAVGAEKSSQFNASRELPALWEVVKGALKNKVIILPFAFLLSYFLPVAISVALVIGALYLSFEGTESLIEKIKSFFHKEDEEEGRLSEKEKIKGAILTDFILSIEIVIMAMSTVLDKDIMTQIIVVSIISIGAVIAVYGSVALLIRLDDIGFFLIKKGFKKMGMFMVNLLPILIKALSWIGMIAMFLVAGGIIVHIFHIESFNFIIGEVVLSLLAGSTIFLIKVVILNIKRIKNEN